jgi:hypothetical protein
VKSLVLCLALGMLGACAGAVESSKLEDRARRTVPVPICLKPLERHGAAGVVSSLKPEDYWEMVLPGFDAGTNSIDRAVPDCAGRKWALSRALRDAEGSRSGPIGVKADAAVVTPGPDGLKVVWLRTHRFAGAQAGGPIALLRPREGYAEVYAIGIHRGSADKSRFGVERMGPNVLVTATDDGCSGVPPHQDCETTFDVYLMRAGRLSPAARFSIASTTARLPVRGARLSTAWSRRRCSRTTRSAWPSRSW